MNTENQRKYTAQWLKNKGWNVASAARRINRSRQHVWAVLQGERRSPKVIAALEALPVRELVFREVVRH